MRSDIHLRILVAPQELKGTLTASEAAEVLADALRDTVPRAELDVAPMADGGPGTVEALVRAGAGQIRTRRVTGPLGGPVEARWGVLDSGRTAVVEMAAASGLSLLAPEALDPERATSFGSGELIRAALDEGCRRIIVGLGGSATNDGGAGAVTALGIQLLDRCGAPLHPGGAELLGLERIELSGRDPRLEQTELQLATDVINPLLGPNGASAVYGPQKGADADTVALLDRALAHFAHKVRGFSGRDLASEPRTGAAGGLAFGLAALCGGMLSPGFELIYQALRLGERLEAADVVITAEGGLDGQTAQGKGPGELARRARAAGKRTVIFAGRVDPAFDLSASPFDEAYAITPAGLPLAEAKARAAALLGEAARRWAVQTFRHSSSSSTFQ